MCLPMWFHTGEGGFISSTNDTTGNHRNENRQYSNNGRDKISFDGTLFYKNKHKHTATSF